MAGLTTDIWEEKIGEDYERSWKNNLACRVFIKARTAGINIKSNERLWWVTGFGRKMQQIVEGKTWKKSSDSINSWGLIYLNQLLDVKGERLIMWQQLKCYKGQSSKGKKATWFKEVEEKVLIDQKSREVQNQFNTNR